LNNQFKGLIKKAGFKERTQKFLSRVAQLPTIENFAILNSELDSLKGLMTDLVQQEGDTPHFRDI